MWSANHFYYNGELFSCLLYPSLEAIFCHRQSRWLTLVNQDEHLQESVLAGVFLLFVERTPKASPGGSCQKSLIFDWWGENCNQIIHRTLYFTSWLPLIRPRYARPPSPRGRHLGRVESLRSISTKKDTTQTGGVFFGGEDDVKDELLISLRETFFDLFL